MEVGQVDYPIGIREWFPWKLKATGDLKLVFSEVNFEIWLIADIHKIFLVSHARSPFHFYQPLSFRDT